MDLRALEELGLPGVNLPRQERSRAVMARLIERAVVMLRSRTFDELSVTEVCAAEGCTVGSFYARFESKEAFIRALQHAVVAEAARGIREHLTAERFAGLTPRQMLTKIVHASVRWSRQHEGLIRASLRAAQQDAAAWSPLRELGRLQAERSGPILLNSLAHAPTQADQEKIGFAFQMLFGTLNNMILVNPGPLTIHDEATPRLLTEAMAGLLE